MTLTEKKFIVMYEEHGNIRNKDKIAQHSSTQTVFDLLERKCVR
jgi:hypothetical protein